MTPKKSFCKLLSLYLILAMIVLTLPAPGWAMFVPSTAPGFDRQSDTSAIQAALESVAVKQRLTDLGLSTEDAMTRINSLSDEQLHQFASEMDSLQAGGNGVESLVFVLLLVILIVLLLQLTGRQVIIR